jgi:hypothetical protein
LKVAVANFEKLESGNGPTPMSRLVHSWPMKMIAEYIEIALKFERMAAEELNPQVKAAFDEQALAYRKLAADRTKTFGFDDTDRSNK